MQQSLFIVLIILISFMLFMYFSTFKYISNDTAVWGAFGDYVGGILNPIFAFLSFTALLVTLIYQNSQLIQNKEVLSATKKAIVQNEKALKLSRKELRNSNRQFSLSAKAQKEIEKTQKVQQFDMLFATLLSELNAMNTSFIDTGKISEFYEVFKSNSKLEYKQVALRKKYQLTRYFIILYQVLKQINDTEFFKKKDKKKYSNIIRASLDNSLLQLLMLNCNCDNFSDDFNDFYSLLEKFSFLEHMDFQNLSSSNYELNFDLILCLRNYKKEAFDKNIYLSAVESIWYNSLIKENIKIKSKYQLFMSLIYKKPFILYGEIDGYSVVLDFIKFKGRIVDLCITELLTKIENSLKVDLRGIDLTFYINNIRASLISDEIEIEFVISKDDVVAHIKFNSTPLRMFYNEKISRGFMNISLKKNN